MDRSAVRLGELVRALPALVPDLGRIARGAVGVFAVRPDSRLSLDTVFRRHAAAHPERPFLWFEGATITYREADERIDRYAAGLAGHGVTRGDVVGVLATNRPETLLVALAAVRLGAVAGMLNHQQRGRVLEHAIGLLSARALVVGAECAEALASLPSRPAGVLDLDTLTGEGPVPVVGIRAGELAFHVLTSGTTGLPKASAMSHLRWLKGMNWFGRIGTRLTGRDTLYCPLPLYHNNALTVSLSAVLAGGATLAIGRSFSVTRFWDEVAGSGATAFCYIGELCRYLLNQPPRPADRAHRVRVAIGNGLRPEIWAAFTERFGIGRVAEFYGASECNMASLNLFNLIGTAGFLPLPFAIVAYDAERGTPRRDPDGRLTRVRSGEVGLLLTRISARFPFDGYTDRRASAAKVVEGAFRPGDRWFTTGDLVRRQGFRHLAFVDRLGDTFRWKGENVATAEVEAVLADHPSVAQAVVYGVPVPGADGQAGMAAVLPRPGATVDGAALARHLRERLPGYAVPLFLRVVGAIDQTATFKARKTELRAQGHDPARVSDPLYVLAAGGYVPAYPGYAAEITRGGARAAG